MLWATQVIKARRGWSAEILDTSNFDRKWIFINCDPEEVVISPGEYDENWFGAYVITENTKHP